MSKKQEAKEDRSEILEAFSNIGSSLSEIFFGEDAQPATTPTPEVVKATENDNASRKLDEGRGGGNQSFTFNLGELFKQQRGAKSAAQAKGKTARDEEPDDTTREGDE
jgi:hypothetical protein